MKRTVLEVICGLLALASMAWFHHQLVRLELQQVDVSALERKVEDAVAAAGDTRDLQQLRQQILQQTEARMASLEVQLANVAAGSTDARQIEGELERARLEVTVFRNQLATDFERTKAMVDAYITEVRRNEQDAAARLSQTQTAVAAIASQLHRDPTELTKSMLLPTVQLNGTDTVGSGTLVFSGENPATDRVESYVLTSHHVVRNILSDAPRAASDGFDVSIYLPGEKLVVKGKMVAHQQKIDAALVRLCTDRVLPNVANVLPRAESGQVKVWDPVCAVGCPLGNDPVPSHGEISSLRNELNGANYWMINAPTYFGNSGGGIYRADTKQLIGVFSKIYTHGKGAPVVVPHMGLCTPIEQIYQWLAAEKLDHLLQSNAVRRPDLGSLAAPLR
ncbi:MAG: trypsin-like serine protease [Planctomycetes bacterium]|nr:trypsin-like serine protease [Planctomycetota bacterium]